MKVGKVALERVATAIERAIEKGLSNVLKDCEVHVSIVIKSTKDKVQPYNSRSLYNPKVHVSE